MKAAILGCGAIGGLFLGYLSKQGIDVRGVVRDYQVSSLKEQGLFIEGVRGKEIFKVNAVSCLREKVDLAVFAVKTGDLPRIIEDNLEYLKEAKILAVQNGVKSEDTLNKYFPAERIVSGIVMFGATFYPPNKVVHNFGEDLILGSVFSSSDSVIQEVGGALVKAFNLKFSGNIKGAKYLKLFINLNNCIPAVLGVSMQEAFSDLELAKLAVKLNREAYRVVKMSGIELEDLPSYPKKRIEDLVSLDIGFAASIFSKVMGSLSKEPLYGSILQSIKRKKPSEIDYINGEIVSLAKRNNLDAPLNRKITELVHRVESSGKFLGKDELSAEMDARDK